MLRKQRLKQKMVYLYIKKYVLENKKILVIVFAVTNY